MVRLNPPENEKGEEPSPADAQEILEVDVSHLYADTGTAKLARLAEYEQAVLARFKPGQAVRLTGPGPVWLYLRLAHALHGKAGKLLYSSPVTGDVVIFDHDPF